MLAVIGFAVVLSLPMQAPEPVGHGRAEVEAVFTTALPALEQCNSHAVASIATFDVLIAASGSVSNVVHASHGESPRLDLIVPCLIERLRGLKFAPRLAAEVHVEFQLAQAATVRDMVVLTSSDPPEVQLSPAASSSVMTAVAPRLPELVDCYRTTLQTSPTVAGTLVVRQTVGADGAVVDDRIVRQPADEILHVPLTACVQRVLRGVHYATSTSTSTSEAVVPLRFIRLESPTATALHSALKVQALALWNCLHAKREFVALSFTVDSNGTPNDVSLTDAVDVACARAVVERVRWPAPAGGTVRVSAKLDAHGGGLSRGEIQAVVTGDLWRIKHCYDIELNRDHLLQGTVIAHYVIGPDGAVLDVRTLRPKPDAVELTNPRVVQCIVDVIRGHRYPQPKGGGIVNVTYPFVFAPGP